MNATIPLHKPTESLYGTEFCIPKPLSVHVTKGEINTEMILDQACENAKQEGVKMRNKKSDIYNKSKSYIPTATPTDRSYGAIRFTPKFLIMESK